MDTIYSKKWAYDAFSPHRHTGTIGLCALKSAKPKKNPRNPKIRVIRVPFPQKSPVKIPSQNPRKPEKSVLSAFHFPPKNRRKSKFPAAETKDFDICSTKNQKKFNLFASENQRVKK